MRTIHTRQHKYLVELIKREREARGLSQTAVAKRLRQRQAWLSFLEGGQRRIDCIELLALGRAIGFDPFKAFRRMAKVKNDE